jgi:hypothetical protein
VRLVLHTAAFWLMHGVRAAIPQTDPLAKAEFTTIRERLIKIGARVNRAHRAHPHPIADQLSGGSAVPRSRVRPDALGTLSRRARRTRQINPKRVAHRVTSHTDPTRPVDHARACCIHVQNKPESCIIRVKGIIDRFYHAVRLATPRRENSEFKPLPARPSSPAWRPGSKARSGKAMSFGILVDPFENVLGKGYVDANGLSGLGLTAEDCHSIAILRIGHNLLQLRRFGNSFDVGNEPLDMKTPGPLQP